MTHGQKNIKLHIKKLSNNISQPWI